MPEYIYENPDTGEQVGVWQSVHEDHTYEIEGVTYNRVYTIPNASIDTRIDPNSASEFRDKAKGTLGDIWDQSAEASEKRAKQHDGEDPVKKQFFKDYSAKRKGAKHPKDPSRFS
ncbi:hypothetical protein CMI37_03615 [Candidatus Pacearchaeota archaeon]|nr:hypothetical protein [Candidatus Pacearchaeota archaeon]|tara:strand:+ start:1319 stop:1663 length:345 start_codon:yes stop_codon:yes gene_type:complete